MAFLLLILVLEQLISHGVTTSKWIVRISNVKKEVTRLKECFSNMQLNSFQTEGRIVENTLQQIYLRLFFRSGDNEKFSRSRLYELSLFRKLNLRVDEDLNHIKFKTASTAAIIVVLQIFVLITAPEQTSPGGFGFLAYIFIPGAVFFKIGNLIFYRKVILEFSFYKIWLQDANAAAEEPLKSCQNQAGSPLREILALKKKHQTRMRQLIPAIELIYFLLLGASFAGLVLEKYAGSF